MPNNARIMYLQPIFSGFLLTQRGGSTPCSEGFHFNFLILIILALQFRGSREVSYENFNYLTF